MGKIVKMTDAKPPLDRWRADAVLEPNQPIWGLSAIAANIGLSVDTVRDLAKQEGVPIYRPGGRYFAWSHELVGWLRSK